MAAPTITSIAPAVIKPGTPTPVTVTGTGLGTLVPGFTVTGCSVSAVGAAGSTTATATVQPGGFSPGSVPVVKIQPNWLVSNKAGGVAGGLGANVAQLTTGTHSMIVGGTVTVSGVGAGFDGTWVITAVAATTISYTSTGISVASAASGGNILDVTGVSSSTALAVGTDGYGYAYPQPGLTPGTTGEAVKSVSETTYQRQNPLWDPLTETVTVRSQSQSFNVVPSLWPADKNNPAIDLNTRIQETDLSGPGLGDYVTKGTIGPFQVSNKAGGVAGGQLVNVAVLTFKEVKHPFVVGQSITVAGVDATFNGVWVITAITATTVTVTIAAVSQASVASGGTVIAQYADRPSVLAAPSS